MNAYIEIESLKSFISQRGDERYGECMRMLKRNLNLNFSFSKADALSDPAIQNWIKDLTTGSIALKPNWDCDYPDPENELTLDHITIDKLCAVYLLDDDEPQELANAMLVSYRGQELDTLSKLYVKKDTQEFEYEPSPSQIASWSNIADYTAQCSDILLADRYILSERSLLRKNLYQLIRVLVKKTRSVKVNIVIIVESKKIGFGVDVESVIDTIKQIVEDIVGEEPNVTFLLCSSRGRQPLFHDRLILTNYRAITSGDSFNYFNENGKIRTGGFGITISSLAKNCSYVQDRVIKTFSRQLNNEIQYAVIKGDKKSNFLEFR